MYDISILKNRCNYEYFLEYYKKYNVEDNKVDFQYRYNNITNDEGLKLVYDKYKPYNIVKELDDLQAALKLMEWTFNHLLYQKEGEYGGKQFTIEIMEYSRRNKVSLNCLCHATVLTELLLCLGYKVKKIFAMSCDVMPNENHVVVEAYIDSLGKWIMLDPTLSCYFTDEKNNPLSISEIRDFFIKKNKFNICYYNRFSGRIYAGFESDDYISYLYKDFFRFLVCSTQHSGYVENDDKYYMLVPINYLVSGEKVWNYIGCTCVAELIMNSNIFWR